MTEAEFRARREVLYRRISLMARQALALEREFADSLPFRPGDPVCISGRFAGWLVSISPSIYQWDIRYNPPKKDGTRSAKEQIANCPLSSLSLLNTP